MNLPSHLDPNALTEVLLRHGFNLDDLKKEHPSIAVVGSHAAGCATANSDWDVILFGRKDATKRLKGLDLMYEDPPNDPAWSIRDQAFHASGFAVWLQGGPNWSVGNLDWKRAAERRGRFVLKQADALAMSYDLLGPRAATHAERLLDDARRVTCLKTGVYIPPRVLLAKIPVDETVLTPCLDLLREHGHLGE